MRIVYKILLTVYKFILYSVIARISNAFLLKANGVDIKRGYKIRGFMYFDCHSDAQVSIGEGFVANSGFVYNHIGRQRPCSIVAKKDAFIQIGNNVGMSASTVVSQKKIFIGDGVRFGGNVVVYDSDFHSLDATDRTAVPEIKTNIRCKEVIIKDNVFVGAHATILKGSHIGENSIIGACAVVSGYIPPNEVWAGNPARFLKRIRNAQDYTETVLLHS